MKQKMSYEYLEKKLNTIRKRRDKLDAEIQSLKSHLKTQKKQMTLACPCGQENKICDLELIKKYSEGWQPCGEDHYVYQESAFFICPHCKYAFDDYTSDVFQQGLAEYVKVVHEWYADRGTPTRVRELMQPHWDREAKAEQEAKRVRELEAARKLLREAGELKDS